MIPTVTSVEQQVADTTNTALIRQLIAQCITEAFTTNEFKNVLAKAIEESHRTQDSPPGSKRAVYGHAADEQWGFPFGIDGLMDPDEAGKFLAVSGRQLDRLAAVPPGEDRSRIRKGLMPSGVRRFCRHSVTEFAQGLEK